MINHKYTVIRVLLFCLFYAIALVTFSGLVKDFNTEWNQHILLIITIAITYGLTLLFVKWEKLKLKEVGVVAINMTFKKVVIGFGIGYL